jgi:hypothetical protein
MAERVVYLSDLMGDYSLVDEDFDIEDAKGPPPEQGPSSGQVR